jgi:hypothetical protein
MPTRLISEKSDLQSATDVTISATGPTDYSDCVLLTIHGVTSTNEGLANIRTYCQEQLPGLACDSYFYGQVVPFSDLSEAVTHAIFQAIRDKIELVYLKHLRDSKRRLYVVAHSFGTLAVVRALEMRIPGATIEALILLGSIVPRDYRWDGLVEDNQLRNAPFAVVRPNDEVVLRAGLVGGAASGAMGFIANGRFRVLETYKNGGHTAYDPDDGPDIVAIVRSGIESVALTNYAGWQKSCGSLRGWRARLSRLFRL